MNQAEVLTKVAEPLVASADSRYAVKSLFSFLPGIKVEPSDPVSISVPNFKVRCDESGWKSLLSERVRATQRRAMLGYLKALKALNEYATKEDVSLAEAAQQRADLLQRTLEQAWVSLLEQNRHREETIRWCSLLFSNMQDSAQAYRGKIFAIDASAEEIASDTGRELLGNLLADYYNRPDPREARAYLVVNGWVGSVENLHRLARVTQTYRAMLFTDAPAYDDPEKLRAAAEPGGLLEQLASEETFMRYTVLFGNQGRTRRRFQGKYAAEKEDVYIPLAGPYFGMHLDNVVRGFPWKPAIGYRNPIGGIDGVKLDLLLKEKDGYAYFANHRINPGILLANGSPSVVVWGPDALYKADNGFQIGVAETELRMIRYAEWIVNKYGMYDDLEKAEEVIGKMLTRFVTDNSGANRMFRSGSRIEVSTNNETRCLIIDFHLFFRPVIERALLRLSKPLEKEKHGDVTIKK